MLSIIPNITKKVIHFLRIEGGSVRFLKILNGRYVIKKFGKHCIRLILINIKHGRKLNNIEIVDRNT